MGRGRHFDLNLDCAPPDMLREQDRVLIVTDHSTYHYPRIVHEARLVIDRRNATQGIRSNKIVRC